jgi:transmembrane sensor
VVKCRSYVVWLNRQYMELKEAIDLELIIRCLEGTAGDQDFSILKEWIMASPENRKYYLQVKNIRDLSGRKLLPEDIDASAAMQKVLTQISKGDRVKRFIMRMQKIAALMLIPLLAASFFWGRSMNSRPYNENQKMVYNEVTAAFGTRSTITLSDGSRVWLNSGSTLRYPDRFVGRKRLVNLSGEGYFEVNSDAKHPFIVSTGKLAVQATGTKFNVNAIGMDRDISVTLVSGVVAVSKATEPGKTELIAKMEPDQHLSFDTLTEKSTITTGDTYRYIGWKDGKLMFRNEPLERVIKEIGLYYNVDLEIVGESLKEYRYRATFEEENINEILRLLKLSSPVDYREIKRQPMPDGSFSKKKFIIFPAGTNLKPKNRPSIH